jgi:hypothetical protein
VIELTGTPTEARVSWQSFLKEQVRSTLETECSWFLDLSFAVLRQFLARRGRGEALGSRIDPAGSTAKRPEVLDADAGRRTLIGAERRRVG